MIDHVLIDMPKSCEWLIGVRIANDLRWFNGVLIFPSLVNNWSESWHAQVLRMIDQSPDTPVTDF